ncbi:MAG: hypothetical protein ACTTJW_06980 [Sphaerochaeta sp.]
MENNSWYVKKEDIELHFKEGVAETEVLKGMYPTVRCFRGEMKPYSELFVEPNGKIITTYLFTSGTGYILTKKKAYNIEEVSYFFANPEEEYTIICCAESLVYTKFELTLIQADLENMSAYAASHLVLPLFRKESDLLVYDQNVKIGKTLQKSVVAGKQMIRIIVGSNWADEDCGFYEIGHNAVAQWNVCHGNCDIDMTVNGETINQKSGDLSYIEAGLPHGSIARKGKCLQYIYYEVYVQEKGFLKTLPEGPFEDISKKN